MDHPAHKTTRPMLTRQLQQPDSADELSEPWQFCGPLFLFLLRRTYGFFTSTSLPDSSCRSGQSALDPALLVSIGGDLELDLYSCNFFKGAFIYRRI